MRAAVLKDKLQIAIEEIPVPQIKPDEVLVEVKVCGICGSDLHAYTDLTFPPGTVMGHEFSGVITQTGAQIKNWQAGQRVVVRPCGICGECYYCINGQISICPTHMNTTLGLKRPGAYAEYVAVPEYMLFALPDNISFEQAAQLEPVTVAVHALNMAQIQLGETVLVYGAGPIGLLTMQLSRLAGASEIVIVEKSELRREIARKLGFNNVYHPADFDGAAWCNKLPRPGFDLAFECAGVEVTIQETFKHVRKGGRIIMLGLSPQPVSIDHFQWIVKGIEVRASMGYFINDFQVALNLLEKGSINVDALVTDIISLEDVVEKGFNRLLNPEQSVKILLRP